MAKIKRPSKNLVVLGFILLLAIGSAGFLYANNSRNTQPASQASKDQEVLNLDPPSEDEVKQAQENKQRIDAESERIKSQQDSQTNLKDVTPVISFAEQNGNLVEVGSYIPGIFEDGGTCTVLFVKGTSQVTQSVKGVKEGSNTFCPKFTLSRSEFSEGGSWSATVTYQSSYASGRSEPRNLEIK